MKIFFVVNPAAGNGKMKNWVDEIENIMKDEGTEYSIKYTSCPKDGIKIARKAAEDGYNRIIAVGGDGTVNEVLNGVMGSDAALGVIPAGSGNDFIKSINTHRDREQLIRDAVFGEVKRIDAARCGDRFFVNVSSAGMDAQVVVETMNMRRYFKGKFAYLAAALKTLATYNGCEMLIDIDGKKIEGKMLLIAVANGRYYGGGMQPAPSAELDDGLMDICLVSNVPKLKALRFFPKFIKGTHNDGSIKEVGFYKGKRITVHSDRSFGVNIDGEIIFAKDIDFEVIPNSLNVIYPV